VPYRQQFAPGVKMVSVWTPRLKEAQYTGREVRSSDQPKEAAKQIYPGVEMFRGLMLTREYLFDVFHLTSETPRQYHWLVHALGEAQPDRPADWQVSDELQNTLFNTPEIKIDEARRHAADAADWTLKTVQTRHGEVNRLGDAWYGRQVGVRVHMLGEAGTTVFHFRPPLCYTPGSPRAPAADKVPTDLDESGGVSLAVARHKPVTTFIALHEPFENGQPRLTGFARIAQNDVAVAARITGPGINDRVLVRFDDKPDEPVTLSGDGESFTFAGQAHVRIGSERVEVSGHVLALRVKVAGAPQLIVNGKQVAGKTTAGVLGFGE
jgi:hypothetical protein